MLQVALCLAMWVVVLLPGVLFARRHLGALPAPSQLFIGASASVALLTWLALIETHLVGVGRVTPALWAAITLAAVIDNRDMLRAAWWREFSAAFERSAELQGLALVLVGSALVRVIPLPFSLLPPGYDPMNHLLLARLIVTNDAIPTSWMPFEPVEINYPTGLHNLLALMSRVTRLDITFVWRSMYPAFGALAAVAAYAFARLATPRPSTALWIAGSYSVLVNMGSLEIYGWGGMINLGAWCFGLALVLLVTSAALTASTSWKAHLLGGLLVAAVCISHHHVMLSVGVVCLAVIAVTRLRFRERGVHRALLLAAAIGGALAAFQLVPFALKVTQVGRTDVLSYLEPFYGATQLVRSLGLIFPVLAFVGMRRFLGLRAELAGAVLAASLLSLVGVFALIEYGYQGVHYLLTSRRSQPFVPARFLTNSVLFMAAPVGIALERGYELARARGRWLAVAMLGALTLQPVYHVAALCQNTTSDDEYRALVWIRDHTPPDAFVLNERGSGWVNFFCWRETSFTPLSASEPSSRHRAMKLDAAIAHDRRVYLMGLVRGARPVFAAGNYSLYRMSRQRPAREPPHAP